jgi:magnesium chelatase subunit I
MALNILEQIGFEARKSEFIDVKSCISARMAITAYENLISAAELRLIHSGDKATSIRMSDFLGIIPAITGKVELVYEGEQEGAEEVALLLLGDSIKSLFAEYFLEIKKLAKDGEYDDFDKLTEWFINNTGFELLTESADKVFNTTLNSIEPLDKILNKFQPNTISEDIEFMKEFILWGLVEYKKLAKNKFADGFEFEDNILKHY